MNSLFEDLKEGLAQAIAYEEGIGRARVKVYTIKPLREYSNEEIRTIRMKAGMTQSVFAAFMEVSKKTVEAWECGTTHPSGPAFRLLDVLLTENIEETKFILEK